MADGIKKALDYVESNVSYAEKAIEAQCAAWRGEKRDIPPLLLSCPLTEEQNGWLPEYNYKEIHFDSEKMLASELRKVLTAVNGGYGAVPSVRANMGCGIIPSLFGIRQSLFEDKMPWMLEHLKKEDIKEINGFDIGGSKEFAAGMGHMEYMAAALRENGLEGSVFVYPLDLQGAVDTAHLVCGDNIFYEFYDDPGFVHRLLALSREAIYFAMDECFKRMAQSNEIIPHYNYLVMPRESGGLKLSEDTTTLISPGQIDEFAKPHLRKILERFGGGYVHYCGKNDHLLDVLLKEPLVRGINLGNSEKHGMKEVLEKCRDNKKVYVAGIARFENESHYDFFTRILAPSYDAETGRFYVLPTYGCDISERGQVIGEFERAAENVKNHK